MMARNAKAVEASELAYKVHSLLRILSLAVDGTEISKRTIENSGGSAVIDLMVDMTGQLVEILDENWLEKEAAEPNM